MYRLFAAVVVSAGALCASGNQTRTPTAANAAEIRISSATVPVGGTVQLQFSLTEPRPIMSTGGSFAMNSFDA
ncbi:MAG: hypothetical protein JWN34_4748 [Bryobacterales bacterium]|nr:hypothetical protein [Bryobacterales bacterium]